MQPWDEGECFLQEESIDQHKWKSHFREEEGVRGDKGNHQGGGWAENLQEQENSHDSNQVQEQTQKSIEEELITINIFHFYVLLS